MGHFSVGIYAASDAILSTNHRRGDGESFFSRLKRGADKG